jgi:small redox-active disulfide protein 2
MKIEIFGPGCSRCNALEKMVVNSLARLNISAEVVKVSDINKMVERGIMFTPALFIDGKKKSEGKVPSIDDIKKWLIEGGEK